MGQARLCPAYKSVARRRLLEAALAVGVIAVLPRLTEAQTYPARPVRLIVPFGSAGATDIVARLIGQWLSQRLGQSFVIENRPGAGGNIGIEAVVRSPPDGYTLALIGLPSAINVTLYDNLPYNFSRDIMPVASVVRFPNVMVVNPSVPASSVPEFIAYAKAHPGKLNMSSRAGYLRHERIHDRICQGGNPARIGGDHRDPLAGAPRAADHC
jgi:tripartite-type tricarboxylate transporter receptor subunit TctC